MFDAITDVAGLQVGHWHDNEALTGCTVILCPKGAVVGVDVRGAAPGTRETDLCRPGTLVDRAHAILLSGGSAFGLDAASGVMRFLREREIGFDTGVTRVPIVPGAVLFDLAIGDATWPTAESGYLACIDARSGPVVQGCVGAGMGATVGKLLGMGAATKSGVGTASIRVGGVTVAALVAVNAFGNVVLPGTGEIVAGARPPASDEFVDMEEALRVGASSPPHIGENTTIGVVATDADLTSTQIAHLALCAHDGLARSIRPAHTMLDGDTLFSLSTGAVPVVWADWMIALGSVAADVTARAIVAAVMNASPVGDMRAGRFPR